MTNAKLPNNCFSSWLQIETYEASLVEQGVEPDKAKEIAPLLAKDSMSPQEQAVVVAAWRD